VAATDARPGGVLCSGNIVCDILVQPVDRVIPGATIPVERVERHMGGNGSNTAYALGILGARVHLLGSVGADEEGEFVLRRLCSAGVDTSMVGRSAKRTATTIVLVSTDGQRSFLHLFGASADVEVDPSMFARCGCSHYHLASPFGLPAIRRGKVELLSAARAAGMTTSLDTHWDSLGEWMRDLALCLPLLDLLFLNEDEARMLTGIADPLEAARAVRSAGAAVVLLKRGARGCMALSADGERAVAGYRVETIDSTGAGDCFAGGFLAARERGAAFLEAAEFANAVGALSVSALGATEGLRSYEETRAWIASAERIALR
jgi:sugar/nucleoside kinase (ribokinase family)